MTSGNPQTRLRSSLGAALVILVLSTAGVTVSGQGGSNYEAGTIVAAADSDTNVATSNPPGGPRYAYWDNDGSGTYSSADSVYLDLVGNGVVNPGDIRLTPFGVSYPGYTRVESGDPDALNALAFTGMANLGTEAFTDDDMDGAFDNDEMVYLDQDADAIVSLRDVRLTTHGTLTAGAMVLSSDADFGNPLAAGPWLFVCYVDDDANGLPGTNEPVYLQQDVCSDGTAANDVRFTDVGGSGPSPSPEPAPSVTVTPVDATAHENGDSGRFRFARSGSTADHLTVRFTVSGTATHGADYAAIGDGVTIVAGSTSEVLTVHPIDDEIVEPTETVVVTLLAQGDYVIASPNSATVNLFDNDQPSPTQTPTPTPTPSPTPSPTPTMDAVTGKAQTSTGAALVGVPLFLLASQGGVLHPVGASVTGPDGAFSIPDIDGAPTHAATFRDGHVSLVPLPADWASGGSFLSILPTTPDGFTPATAADLDRLEQAVAEVKAIPFTAVEPPERTRIELEGYHGLIAVEFVAAGSNLQLVVAKLNSKGFDQIPDPPRDPVRWFALTVIEANGAEVPVQDVRIEFTGPDGAPPDQVLALQHFVLAEQRWESRTSDPRTGVYAADFGTLSLYAVANANTVSLMPYAYTAGALLGLGIVVFAVTRLRKRQLHHGGNGVSLTAQADARAPPRPIRTAIPLKSNEILASGVGFRVGSKQLLTDVSFMFRQGEILALLGPSGCGKSTLLKCVIGENHANGELNVFGFNPRTDRSALKQLVGYVAQETQLYGDMTVRENVRYFGKQFGIPRNELAKTTDSLLATLGLADRATTKVKVLSGGQQRRASIAATLVHTPALLILDEPTSGLDPVTRRNLWKFIRQANRDLGVTVVVTTHFLDEAEFADRVVIMDRGRVVATGAPQELIRALPGGGRLVVVELQNTNPDMENRIRQATQTLAAGGNVQKVDITGYTVRFFVADPQAASRVLLDMFARIDVPIKSLASDDARMEDVFVHFAGQSWTDAEP